MGILSLKPYLVHSTGEVPLIFLWILFLKTLKFLEVKSPEPIQKILKILQSQGDPKRAQVLQRFFWDRRIAVMATFHFIKKEEFSETLRIAELLLRDSEELIHKAVGWMLREIGKRNQKVEESFLKTHYQKMPRTMLRYALEKFPEESRQRYLKGNL